MGYRPLSKELQLQAEQELNEKPERVQEDIAHIREWISKQRHLKARTDDQFILTFLRGCKFSLERTKEKIDMYYTMRTLLPEFFTNRDPLRPEIQNLLKMGLYLPLPKTKGPTTPRCAILRTGAYDPKINVTDLFKLNMMITEIMFLEDDQMVISGFTMVQDMKGINLNHMIQMTPALVKKAMTVFYEAYPNRPKASHFVNIPSFFESIFTLFKPFMKEKIIKRMQIHMSSDWSNLYEDVPKRILPKEYGGEDSTVEELTKYWLEKVNSYRDWFLADQEYKSDESKRIGTPKTSDNVFGLEGSFRKLNVD